jgi:hypothetical protein
MFRILSQTFKVHDKGVAYLRMNKVFVIDMIDLLGLNNIPLIEKFECNIFSGLFVLSNLNFTEASLTKNPSDLIILKLKFSDGLCFAFLHGMFKYQL